MSARRFKICLRYLCIFLIFIFVLGTAAPAHTAAADPGASGLPAAKSAEGLTYAEAFNKIADPATNNAADYFLTVTKDRIKPEDNDGRLWTDKTVSADEALIYDVKGKPISSIKAEADEFLVTLSALSQTYTTVDVIMEPSDTVFVLDISASMYMNDLDEISGISRVAAMITALNMAIDTLMTSNPGNRVAVVAFGGEGGPARICQILPLARYDNYVRDGQYFFMSSPAYVDVDSDIPNSALSDKNNRHVRVWGSTSTQLGIYAGAQILLKESTTKASVTVKGQTVEVSRKPNIVLLSDGGATMGWKDYTFKDTMSNTFPGFDVGDGDSVDIGIDILTVLTAAYCKQKVRDHYYGENDTASSTGFYTIGLGVANASSKDAIAILDPMGTADGDSVVNAEKISRVFNKTKYNMKERLDMIVSGGGDVDIPVMAASGKEADRTTTKVSNEGDYIKNYSYTDEYYPAENVAALALAFESIAQRIVSTGNYSTSASEDPEYSGYLTFSDVLGEGMEFRGGEGLWFNSVKYDGHLFAQDVIKKGNGAYRELATVLETHGDVSGGKAQALLDSCIAAGKANGGLYYTSQSDYGGKVIYYGDSRGKWVSNYFDGDGQPITAVPGGAESIVELYSIYDDVLDHVTAEKTNLIDSIFQVVTSLNGGYQSEAYPGVTRTLKKDQQEVRWYIPASLIPARTVARTNAGDADTQLKIKDSPPVRAIYAVGLREESVLAMVEKDNETLDPTNTEAYYKAYYYKNPFYTNMWNGSASAANGTATAYFQPNSDNPYYSGGPSPKITKGENKTSTALNATESFRYTTEGGGIYRLLGNNGRIEVPSTRLAVAVMWHSDDSSDYNSDYSALETNLQNTSNNVAVQLILNGAKLIDVALINDGWDYFSNFYGGYLSQPAVLLAGERLKNIPLYKLKPNANGHVEVNKYTAEEGELDNSGTFTPYAGITDIAATDTDEYSVYSSQPDWAEFAGLFYDAVFLNYKIPSGKAYLYINKVVTGVNPFADPNINVKIEFKAGDKNFTYPFAANTLPVIELTTGQAHYTVKENATTYTPPEIANYFDETTTVTIDEIDAQSQYDSSSGTVTIQGTDVTANKPITVTFTNNYEYSQDYKDDFLFDLTINKTINGLSSGEYPDNLAFEIIGKDSSNSDIEIYNNTHYFYDGNSNGDPFKINDLPPGNYTITELNGDVDGYSCVVSHSGDGTFNENSKSVTLAGTDASGSNHTPSVTFTNDYKKYGTLTIIEEIVGLDNSGLPSDELNIMFQVASTGRTANDFERIVEYEDFPGSTPYSTERRYTLEDVPPGTYAIIDKALDIDGYTMAIENEGVDGAYENDPVDNPLVPLINFREGDKKTIKFRNIYTRKPSAALTIEKAFTGITPSQHTNELNDIAFVIKDKNGQQRKFISYEDFTNNSFTIPGGSGLDPGTYTIEEVHGEILGYVLNSTVAYQEAATFRAVTSGPAIWLDTEPDSQENAAPSGSQPGTVTGAAIQFEMEPENLDTALPSGSRPGGTTSQAALRLDFKAESRKPVLFAGAAETTSGPAVQLDVEPEGQAQTLSASARLGGAAYTFELKETGHHKIIFTNNYAGSGATASLKLTKSFSGLNPAAYPAETAAIEFLVENADTGSTFRVSYSSFTNGEYTAYLPPGTYRVTETGGAVGGYDLFVNASHNVLQLRTGESVTASFTNQYSAVSGTGTDGGGDNGRTSFPARRLPPRGQIVPPGNTVPSYNMAIEKALASGQSSLVSPGEEVDYIIRVANTGGAALTDIRVTDEIEGNVYDIALIDRLAPGAYEDYSFTYTVPENAPPGSPIRNTAFAEQAEIGIISDYADIKVTVFTDKHIWYICGYEDNTLRPGRSITRAEITAALYRLLDPSLKTAAPNMRFNDVDGTEWYGPSVGTMAQYGFISGYPDGSFRPNQPITRTEMAALVSQFDHLTETEENPYYDVSPDNWAYRYILSATKKGWFVGDGDGRFRPGDNITRAEFVSVANRVLNRHILLEDLPDGLHKFIDFDYTHWSYTAFMDSLYTHDFIRKPDGLNEEWLEIIEDGIPDVYYSDFD